MATNFKPQYIPTDLIGPDELAPLIQLSPSCIRADVSRRSWRLPPRFRKACSNRIFWSRAEVDKWLLDQARVILP